MVKSKSKAQAHNDFGNDPGTGPASAKEISWPEILKDHMYLMEDHFKLLDALWNHAAQNTGGDRAIAACLNRAKTALEDSRIAVKSFGISPSQSDEMAADHIPLENHSKFNFESVLPNRTDAALADAVSEATNGQGSRPMFVIDTNPMPVNLKGISRRHNKRGGSPQGDALSEEPRRSKRTKTETRSTDIDGEEIEREDITEIVDARLKEKARRREKEEEEDPQVNGKKRKRDLESSPVDESGSELEGTTDDASERPKKKKKKKNKGVNNFAKIRRDARKKKKMEKKEQKRLRKEAAALNKPKKNKQKYEKKKKPEPSA